MKIGNFIVSVLPGAGKDFLLLNFAAFRVKEDKSVLVIVSDNNYEQSKTVLEFYLGSHSMSKLTITKVNSEDELNKLNFTSYDYVVSVINIQNIRMFVNKVSKSYPNVEFTLLDRLPVPICGRMNTEQLITYATRKYSGIKFLIVEKVDDKLVIKNSKGEALGELNHLDVMSMLSNHSKLRDEPEQERRI